MQPFNKSFFVFLFYFFSNFWKSNLTNLTTDVMFSGQRFAILARFLWKGYMKVFGGQVAWFFFKRGCMIFFVERLRDFCVWRGCVIFLTHSLRLHDSFVWRLRDFFCGGLNDFLLTGCGMFCVKRLLDFFVWRGCGIFCVKRFFFWEKKFCGENSFLVKTVFWWKIFFWSLLSLLLHR